MDLETQYLGVVTVAQILSNNFLGKTGNRLTFEVFLIHWICRSLFRHGTSHGSRPWGQSSWLRHPLQCAMQYAVCFCSFVVCCCNFLRSDWSKIIKRVETMDSNCKWSCNRSTEELFTYNRENFKFDQDQRIEREARWRRAFIHHSFLHLWMFFLCFVKSFKTTFLSPHSWKFWRHCAWRCKSSALNCSERSLVLAVSCVFSFLLAYLQSLQSSSFQPHFLVGQPFIRQDVRDLVELTVDRMDVYHLVPWFVGEFYVFWK